MGVPFDHIRSEKFEEESDNTIACLHRQDCWNYVQQIIPDLENLEMLELNACNENEDAELLDVHGNNLLATDLTTEICSAVSAHKPQFIMAEAISSQYVNANNLDHTLFNKKFDLIFSGFGTLNHVSPQHVQDFFAKLPQLIKPGGHFVAIIKPKFCALETLSRLLKLKFKSAFRKSGFAEAQQSEMWYYNPSQIKRWTRHRFKVVSVNPIGLILPSNFSVVRKNWAVSLHTIEKRLSNLQMLSGVSDYFIIDLQLSRY